MDVDAISFQSHLLSILTALSEAHFVALDLELSGVASKPAYTSRSRQTLEERYKEVKEAAERYQILQVGITCAQQDYHNDRYVLRPYNINVSPLVEERLDIERIFSFQSGAVEFLLRNGFKMDLPFTKGVQYLSREEADLAKKLAYDRLDKKTVIEDLQLEDDAIESLGFVKKVREAIIEWQTSNKYASLEITSSIGNEIQPEFPTISRFEKRLVHQLVRAEFPDVVTISKPDFIRIVPLDLDREADVLRDRKKRTKQKIIKQTGFRWIVEAMCKGDLSKIDPISLARNPQGEAHFVNLIEMKSRFHRARDALARRQPILVGHNMFTDLVYFYRTFFGKLPETAREFGKLIHEIFPVIVDTKYMATHNCGDINPASSLQEIAEGLQLQRLPVIDVHPDHMKYDDSIAYHEAGYDSMLTANVMIRLSAKLEAKGTYLNEIASSDSEGFHETAAEAVGVISLPRRPLAMQTAVLGAQNGMVKLNAEQATLLATPPTSADAVALESQPSLVVPVKVASQSSFKKKKKKKNRKREDKPNGGRYAHTTLFEQLRNLEFESEDENDSSQARNDEVVDAPVDGDVHWDDAPYEQHHKPWQPPTPEQKIPMAVMPQFDSDFWKVYGNKLRIFGTMESVLKLEN